MSSDIKYPLQFPAIAVRHPLGEFYLTSMPARVLLQVTYSDVYTRLDDRDVGHQRKIDYKRVRAIGRYIETRDAVFPGTIILAANTRRETGLIDPSDQSCWHIALDSSADSAMERNLWRLLTANIDYMVLRRWKKIYGTRTCLVLSLWVCQRHNRRQCLQQLIIIKSRLAKV